MTENIAISLIENAVNLILASFGWGFALYLHLSTQNKEKRDRILRRLANEVLVRIRLEEVTYDYVETEFNVSTHAMKRRCRERMLNKFDYQTGYTLTTVQKLIKNLEK